MNIKNKMNKLLSTGISYLEISTYFIIMNIIIVAIVISTYIYFRDYNKGSLASLESKIKLSEAISTVFSFILAIEILKIFYIKTYKQLIIVGSLVLLKLTINFFLGKELNEGYKKRKALMHSVI